MNKRMFLTVSCCPLWLLACRPTGRRAAVSQSRDVFTVSRCIIAEQNGNGEEKVGKYDITEACPSLTDTSLCFRRTPNILFLTLIHYGGSSPLQDCMISQTHLAPQPSLMYLALKPPSQAPRGPGYDQKYLARRI